MVPLLLRLVEGRRHRFGVHHELANGHGRAHHKQEPSAVVEVEQTPINDGLREPEPQEEGGEFLGPHHAGVLQPRNASGGLEDHGLPALVLAEAEPVFCFMPPPLIGGLCF